MGLSKTEASAAIREEVVGEERGHLLAHLHTMPSTELDLLEPSDGSKAIVSFISHSAQRGE